MEQAYKILIVDDDPEILQLLAGILERNGMQPRTVNSASEAEQALRAFDADLMVLDLMMPGEDGLSFCRRLRSVSKIPVIMLTALGDDIDRIIGLELGADDYLCKPFNPRELVARIRSVLRRSAEVADPPVRPKKAYRFGSFTLSPDQRALRDEDGEAIQLTSGEFSLLLALVEAAPRVMTRDQLLDLSRGAVANPFDRSIDSLISRIRSKIEPDPKSPALIKTVRNLGYVFAEDVKRVSL
ncbi:response regulator [Maricaulaceae bacterium MS644]